MLAKAKQVSSARFWSRAYLLPSPLTRFFSLAPQMLKRVDAKEEDRKEELRQIRKQNTKVSIFFGGNVGGIQRQRAVSIKEVPDTMKVLGRDMSWAVIPPDSSWKSKWDYLIIVFVLYNSLFIPFSFSFLETRNSMVEVFDYFVDFCS